MRYFSIAPTLPRVSNLALGTATRIFTPENYVRAAALLESFLNAGGNLIDTAHIYNLGASEKTLGRWFQESNARAHTILITKGCHPAIDPNNLFGKPWQPRVTPKAISTDISESLKRLHTDYIDLYLLHRDDEHAPVGPIMDALNVEQKRGRIRAFGASNWHTTRIAQANAYATKNNLNGFIVSSTQFGLVQPVRALYPGVVALSDAERAWHVENQFPLLAYSPLGAGYIARVAQGLGTKDNVEAHAYASDENMARVQRARELAARKNVSPAQIALAYALRQNFPTSAIVGPTTVTHLQQLIQALDISLDVDELAFLKQE